MMAAPLYLKAYEDMISSHEEEFARFSEIHARFSEDQDKWKTKYDEIGKPIQRIISDTENKLCMKMENSGRGKFADSLSDKFRAHVRSNYPLIELIGVTVS
jgi:hypothetical protein